MKNCISIKLALIITVLAAFCHAGDASNRFFRLGTSIGLSYDFLIGKEGNLMDSKDFNGPGFLLAVNTIFNFQDLPALRTGLTYNVRLLKNDVGFTDERLDRDTYVKYETVSLGIPVLAHFQTQSPFYFDAGLTFAFIIDAKEAHYWTKGSAYGFGTNISDTSPAIHILTNITKDSITIVNISDECAYEPRPFDMNAGFLFTYCDELSENPEVVTTQVFDDKMECGTIEYAEYISERL